jgi:hypothetical protein
MASFMSREYPDNKVFTPFRPGRFDPFRATQQFSNPPPVAGRVDMYRPFVLVLDPMAGSKDEEDERDDLVQGVEAEFRQSSCHSMGNYHCRAR